MGNLVSIIFFVLLTIAALTSGISLLEVVVAYFIDQLGWNRKKAVLTMAAAIYLLGVPSALSFGVMGDVKFMGKTFFDIVDNISSNYLLPIGGMLTAVFVGWIWGTQAAKEEIEKHETRFHWADQWSFLIRFIAPVAVGGVFLARFF